MEGDSSPHNTRHRGPRRRPAGSALTVVMAVVFMLLAVVLALHHTEKVAGRTLSQAEAELRFREGRKFAIRERALGTPAPNDLAVDLEVKEITPDSSHEIEKQYASKLFEREGGHWTGLPDLEAEEGAHAHQYVELRSDDRVLRQRRYRLVETEIPGYALYAPQGSVEADRVEGWGNPTFEDSEGVDATSGVPVVIGAQGDVKIGTLTYGEAHSSGGAVDIDNGQGIGFVGPLPLIPYEDPLSQQIQAALASVDASSASGDKTALLNGNPLTLGSMIDLFFGGTPNLDSLIGLRPACSFPIPMIPGFRMLVPGVAFELWFHVPYPPDGGFTNAADPQVAQMQTLAAEQEKAAKALDELAKKLDAASKAREAAEKTYAQDPSAGNQIALDAAKAAEADALEDYEDATKSLEAMAAQTKSIVEGKSSGGMAPVPVTRAQDPAGSDGVFGWNYSTVMGNMLGLLLDTITGDFDNIAKRVSAEVRLVHFGREDNVPHFQFGDTFVTRSTFTVPRGRTMRFQGNMQIQGDLWLQRGSVMAVHGNLQVQAPNAPSAANPYPASGRLFLEEGATLIVHGNFQCQGSPQYGSVMVGGEPGEIHPLTAAILCKGRVDIPYGIFSGSTVDDLLGLELLENAVKDLLETAAPNISKVAGPFHLRRPYFAKYASTFQLTIIPPTLITPPIPIPMPIPMPKENILVFAFRALSLAYTGTLNAALGENLYTHADWWPFGDGVVPMTAKLSDDAISGAVAGALGLLGSDELEEMQKIEDKVKTFAQSFVGDAMNWAIKEGVQKLVKEVAVMLTPGMNMLLDTLVSAIVTEVQGKEKGADELFGDFVTEITNTVAGPMQQVLGNVLTASDFSDPDAYVREHSGALVFAGDSIHIGSQAKLAAGMFVAGNDIDVQADLTIGTLMSRNGDIHTNRVLYYPYFNQASLYLPKSTPSDWMGRAMETRYGEAFDSEAAVQVGPPPVTRRVTAEGWAN